MVRSILVLTCKMSFEANQVADSVVPGVEHTLHVRGNLSDQGQPRLARQAGPRQENSPLNSHLACGMFFLEPAEFQIP